MASWDSFSFLLLSEKDVLELHKFVFSVLKTKKFNFDYLSDWYSTYVKFYAKTDLKNSSSLASKFYLKKHISYRSVSTNRSEDLKFIKEINIMQLSMWQNNNNNRWLHILLHVWKILIIYKIIERKWNITSIRREKFSLCCRT